MTIPYLEKTIRLPSSLLLLLLSGALLFAVTEVRAASGTWSSSAAIPGDWSTAGNWNSSLVADGSTSTATFSRNTAADQTIILDSARTINTIAVSNTNAAGGAWLLTNNGNAANILTLAGTNPTITVSYNVNWVPPATISAIIAGTAGLRYTGGGRLVLTELNTYTGATVISGGNLTISTIANGGSASGIGASSSAQSNLNFNLSTNGTAVLNYAGGSSSTDRGFSISNNSTVEASIAVLQSASTLTMTGGIGASAGNFAKRGAGRLILSGIDSHTGTTIASGGILQFGKRVALYNATPASWTATNIIVNTTLAFNVGGTGEFTSTDLDTLKALGGASNGFKSGSFLGIDTTNASGGTFTYASNIANPNSGANVLGLKKLGSNTLVLGGTSTYTGATHLLGGKLSVSQDANLGNASGTLTFDSGTLLSTLDITMNRATTLNVGGGTFEVDSTKAVTQQGVVSGVGALSKTGAGTLTLTNTNAYLGSTLVTNGTLVISGTGSIASSDATVSSGATLNVNGIAGTVGINAGGTLAGTGTLGATIIAGHHSPGNSPGIQNFASTLDYTNGSSVTWELIGNTETGRGTSFDGINVGTDLTITGTSTINLVFNLGGSTVLWADSFWDTDRSWLFYDVDGSLSGAFALGTLSVDSLGNALGLDRGIFSIGYNGSDVSILYSASAIPEPSTTLLLTGALTALVIFRRRTRNN